MSHVRFPRVARVFIEAIHRASVVRSNGGAQSGANRRPIGRSYHGRSCGIDAIHRANTKATFLPDCCLVNEVSESPRSADRILSSRATRDSKAKRHALGRAPYAKVKQWTRRRPARR